MPPPTVFDRDTAPDAALWLNSTRAFYAPRHPTDQALRNQSERDGVQVAVGSRGFHSRADTNHIGDNHAE